MSHHSSDLPLDEIRRMNELLDRHCRAIEARFRDRLGATGQFPNGKYSEHDEGEIQFAVAADPGQQKVLVDFGKSIRSLGMTAEQAVALGEMLIAKALECRGVSSRANP